MRLKFFSCVEDGQAPELPIVKTKHSACADVKARFHRGIVLVFDSWNEARHIPIDGQGNFTLHPGERACIPTGWKIMIEHGYQIKLVPRSGMALKKGITLINSPGTIDSDYTDELMIIMHNTSSVSYVIEEGDSIAQMEVLKNRMPIVIMSLCEDIEKLERHKKTSDRIGGFGSTGK